MTMLTLLCADLNALNPDLHSPFVEASVQTVIYRDLDTSWRLKAKELGARSGWWELQSVVGDGSLEQVPEGNLIAAEWYCEDGSSFHLHRPHAQLLGYHHRPQPASTEAFLSRTVGQLVRGHGAGSRRYLRYQLYLQARQHLMVPRLARFIGFSEEQS